MRKHFIILGMILIILVSFVWIHSAVNAQEAVPEKAEVQSWKIPEYMLENLNYMVMEFNRQFEIKIESYKAELRKNFKDFKDMPLDVVLDMNTGVFLKRADYLRLQKEAQAQAAQALEKKENK